jgi:DNA polymerase III epsilon subunit-like protein
MKFLCIDIETTGLDPETDNILSIGMVAVDTSIDRPIRECPSSEIRLLHKRLNGTPYAFNMNSQLIAEITLNAKGEHIEYVQPENAADYVANFCKVHRLSQYAGPTELVVAGKNVTTFDLAFLKKLPGWTDLISVHRRVLDPGAMYAKACDEIPPSLDTCLERIPNSFLKWHGLDELIPHRALHDAWLTAGAVLYKLEQE